MVDWLKGTTFAAALGPVPVGDLVVGNRPTTIAGKSVPLKMFDIFRATLANHTNVISDVWYTAPGTAPSSVGLAIQAAQAQGDYGFTPSSSHKIYGLLDKRAIKWFLAHKDIATDLKTWVDSKLRITNTRVTDALRARDRRYNDVYQRRYTASIIPWADEGEPVPAPADLLAIVTQRRGRPHRCLPSSGRGGRPCGRRSAG